MGQVHADSASARRAFEIVGPQLDGATAVFPARASITPRFAPASIIVRIDAESVLVEVARGGDVAAALRDEGEAVEQDGIFGMFDDGLMQVALGFGGGAGVAALRDRLPGQREIAGVASGRCRAEAALARRSLPRETKLARARPAGGGKRTSCAVAPACKLCSGISRNLQNAMVGGLRVCDVRGVGARHVARSAIGLLGVMFRGERLFVAGEAFRAIEGDALFGFGR